jgi:tetratricopeptide (TPR) repeat protein
MIDRVIEAFLGARADTRERLAELLAADPDCALGHCLDGYLHMMAGKRDQQSLAVASLRRARSVVERSGEARRDQLHLIALDAWTRGEMREAAGHWDVLLTEFPRDILGLRVSQFVLSYLGESQRMRYTISRALPAWDSSVPGYGYLLGCYAYGLEEAGEYAQADEVGRKAIEINRRDIWAAHAVTHVAEMEGRLHDGLAWVAGLSEQWTGCNNFALHLRWHEALFRLDLEQYDRVLELYDREVRRQSTDEYLDVTNAVSLLWRLEQAEVDVGTRWRELADCARRHDRDHSLVFADLHYVMALAAVGEPDAFLASCEQFVAEGGTESAVMADVGLPLARAVLAHRRGAYDEVVDRLMPVRSQFRRIGGSHAQRDLFDQLLIDAAWRGRRLDAAAELLAERTTRRPRNIWGWKHYAAVLDAQGGSGAADARGTLDALRGR